MDADFFERLHAVAKQQDADIAKGQAWHTEINGRPRLRGPSLEDIAANRAFFTYSFWSAIYRREFLRRHGIDFPAGVITGQDSVFLAKAVLQANRIALCRDAFYHHLRRENSLDSRFLPPEKIDSKITAVRMIVDFINSTELDEEVYGLTFQSWLNYLLENVLWGNPDAAQKARLVRFAIGIYRVCRTAGLYRARFPVYAEYLAGGDAGKFLAWLTDRHDRQLARLNRKWRKYRMLQAATFGLIGAFRRRKERYRDEINQARG